MNLWLSKHQKFTPLRLNHFDLITFFLGKEFIFEFKLKIKKQNELYVCVLIDLDICRLCVQIVWIIHRKFLFLIFPIRFNNSFSVASKLQRDKTARNLNGGKIRREYTGHWSTHRNQSKYYIIINIISMFTRIIMIYNKKTEEKRIFIQS